MNQNSIQSDYDQATFIANKTSIPIEIVIQLMQNQLLENQNDIIHDMRMSINDIKVSADFLRNKQ